MIESADADPSADVLALIEQQAHRRVVLKIALC